MRLLIVASAFPPNSAVGTMRPLRWCKHLTAHTDWQPTVISVRREGPRDDASLLLEVPATVGVHRVPSFEPLRWLERRAAARGGGGAGAAPAAPAPAGPAAPPVRSLSVRRFVRDLLATPDEHGLWNLPVVAKALQLHRAAPFDAVLVTSPPWSAQFAGCALGRLLSIPWIADYRDPWNDIDRGHRTHAFERWSRRLEDGLLPHAAAVISTSDTYSGQLRARFPRRDPGVFVTIHNGFDETKIPARRPAPRRRFTLVHLGTLYELWEPYDLFAGVAAWLGSRPELRPDVVLRFVGQPGPRALARLAQLGLGGIVEATGFVDHATAIARCREADVLLLALGAGPEVPAGWLPSKLFEYVAFDRPILANVPDGEARRLIAGAGAGFTVGSEGPAAYAAVLEDLHARKRAAADGRLPWANRPEAVARLTQHHLGAQLAAVLDGVRRRPA